MDAFVVLFLYKQIGFNGRRDSANQRPENEEKKTFNERSLITQWALSTIFFVALGS